jgi:hypothetical protein
MLEVAHGWSANSERALIILLTMFVAESANRNYILCSNPEFQGRSLGILLLKKNTCITHTCVTRNCPTLILHILQLQRAGGGGQSYFLKIMAMKCYAMNLFIKVIAMKNLTMIFFISKANEALNAKQKVLAMK